MKISLVVPVRNEEQTADRLWYSIQEQTVLPDEVIFVDGGSTDGTRDLLGQFRHERIAVRILCSSDAHPGEARNLGVQHAKHDWIAFTDAGIVLRKNWLEQLCRRSVEVPDAQVIYGSFEPLIRSRFDRIAALTHVVPRNPALDNIRGPWVASMMLKRRAFDLTGGFPRYRAAEDLMFIQKLAQANIVSAAAPQAVVDWMMPNGPILTLQRFYTFSQHNLLANWGRYWHRAIAIHWAIALLLVALAPIHTGLLILPLTGLLVRGHRSIVRRRAGILPPGIVSPLTLLAVAGVSVLIDIATLAGAAAYWVQWLTGRGIVRADRARALSPDHGWAG